MSEPLTDEDLRARVAQLEERLDELATRDEAKIAERAAQMIDAKIKANFKEQVERMNELDAPGIYWPSPAQPQATHADLALAIIQRAVERLIERALKTPRSQDFVNMEEVDRGVKVSVSRAENVEGRFKIHLCVRDDAASLVLARTELSESFITSASSVSAWAWAMLREQLDTALAIALSIKQINVDEEPAR